MLVGVKRFPLIESRESSLEVTLANTIRLRESLFEFYDLAFWTRFKVNRDNLIRTSFYLSQRTYYILMVVQVHGCYQRSQRWIPQYKQVPNVTYFLKLFAVVIRSWKIVRSDQPRFRKWQKIICSIWTCGLVERIHQRTDVVLVIF